MRCRGSNFFESVPGKADLHMLKRILHVGSDGICEGILRRCRAAACKAGGFWQPSFSETACQLRRLDQTCWDYISMKMPGDASG